jgi:hypothetical protein
MGHRPVCVEEKRIALSRFTHLKAFSEMMCLRHIMLSQRSLLVALTLQ